MRFFTKKIPQEDLPPISHETSIIKCACCEESLVEAIEILEIKQEKPTKYKFSCPFCGKSSFTKTTEYDLKFSPLQGLYIETSSYSQQEEYNSCLIQLKKRDH